MRRCARCWQPLGLDVLHLPVLSRLTTATKPINALISFEAITENVVDVCSELCADLYRLRDAEQDREDWYLQAYLEMA